MFSSLNETEIQENIPAMLVTLRGMAGYKNNQNALSLWTKSEHILQICTLLVLP